MRQIAPTPPAAPPCGAQIATHEMRCPEVEIWTTDQVLDLLGISRERLLELVNVGELRQVARGVFDAREVRLWLATSPGLPSPRSYAGPRL